MKRLFLYLSLLSTLLIASCSSEYTFFQVCRVQSLSPNKTDGTGLVFEDDNCKISYDLWSEGGLLSFLVFNKTDKILYIDLTKSFFVKNGYAYDYFQNTTSSNNTSACSSNNCFGTSIAIPPHAAKKIAKHTITDGRFLDCDLLPFPENTATMIFNKENTPLVIENFIAYYVGEERNNLQSISNSFFLSSITNIAEPSMFSYLKREKPCQNKTDDVGEHYQTEYLYEVFDRLVNVENAESCYYMTYTKFSSKKLYKRDNYNYDSYYEGYINGYNPTKSTEFYPLEKKE